MIIEVSFSFDHLPTQTLETFLLNDYHLGNDSYLSEDALLHICSILAKRKSIDSTDRIQYLKEKWNQLQDSL